eukprot:3500366-Rhodomonas_salina.1
MCINPNGQELVVGCTDGTLLILSSIDLELLQRSSQRWALWGTSGVVLAGVPSAGRRGVFSVGRLGYLALGFFGYLACPSGYLALPLRVEAPATSVEFSPEGTHIAMADGQVRGAETETEIESEADAEMDSATR